ncbi:MAG: hypothetical protein AAFY76_22780, partial [Cyanobacteria bacterium J06649_11]
MSIKNTIYTVWKLVNYARQGVSLSDKCLAFLVAGLGIMGYYRARLRSWFTEQIHNFAKEGFIELHFKYNGQKTRLFLRAGNSADYLMAGELVRGGYELPNFEPQVIIDGGANIGMFAIQALRHFPKAKLICYEPDSSNF